MMVRVRNVFPLARVSLTKFIAHRWLAFVNVAVVAVVRSPRIVAAFSFSA